MRFIKVLLFFILLTFGSGSFASIIPPEVVSGQITPEQHPFAENINAFLVNQAAQKTNITTTGLTRSDYLKTIESIVLAMMKYLNSKGQIIDPVQMREVQYSTPCFAHAVAVLCGSGYNKDATLLQAGIKAMDASIAHMLNKNVPDSHGDFFTAPMMLAFQNFKNVVSSSQISKWRTDLAKINPSAVYGNSAPNWIGINMTGEFYRYLEGMTTVSYVEKKMSYQITRMGRDGLYQDSYNPETTTVKNSNGNSFAYDNVARSMLGQIAHNGYEGEYARELNTRLWKGAWTGLFYQSPFGEVPTGLRSSHHFWNEAAAAINYEIWAAHYAKEGRMAEAGAFKRAAMLSLATVNSWLRPDGSGYVTKARYPIEDRWGYMTYSSHTQYNMWCAAALATAWQYGDSTIKELPAPCDIGGFVVPILPGFKKIVANAGGTYVQFDIRGDHSHTPTGLLRVHLKSSYPQLGPSDGAVGQYDRNVQYHPLYPDPNPVNLKNLSIGPGWLDSKRNWYPLAEMQTIPEVDILEETPMRSSFKVTYTILGKEKLHETIIVEPGGVTITDTIAGGDRTAMRVYYPMLLTDGEDETKMELDGNTLTLQLKQKGVRFSILNPNTAEIKRTNVQYNHRNGKCEAVYADINGTTAKYRLTAWPEYVSAKSIDIPHHTRYGQLDENVYFVTTQLYAPERLSGSYTAHFYSMQGTLVATATGMMTLGKATIAKNSFPEATGIFRVIVSCEGTRLQSTFMQMR